MNTIETDYLVVGAGAAGMAFTDALVADSDAEVVMVDRRHCPGGHWNDAYPFVRLHQPSAFYGVNSRVLGSDTIDDAGHNAGLYERATAAQICDYYQRVLDEHLLPSGQVRFFGMSEYLGDDGPDRQFVSLLTGGTTTVRVRRKVVDARYLEPLIPATHTPSFSVDPDATLVPVNDLAKLSEPKSGYTIIGGGKTALDACVWLVDNGVEPDRIRWIRPREAWMLDRVYLQPLDLVPWLFEGLSLDLKAAAEANSVPDLFAGLEACGQLVRIDPNVTPTMYRCATVSATEVELARSIENVVRMGHVHHIGTNELTMEHGRIETDPGQLNVDCSAAGLRPTEGWPVFERDRITLQPVRTCLPPFNAAFVAFIEATREDDTEKTRLCPTNRYPNTAIDWMPNTYIMFESFALWNEQPDVVEWLERSRLNLARGVSGHADDPRMQSALTRLFTYLEPGVANLRKLHEEALAA